VFDVVINRLLLYILYDLLILFPKLYLHRQDACATFDWVDGAA